MCLRQWDSVDEPFISGCNRPGFSEAEVERIWDGRYLRSIDADGLAQKVLWHKQPTQMTSAGQTRFPLTFYSWGKPWKSDLEGVCRPQCRSERGFLPPSVICVVLFRKGISWPAEFSYVAERSPRRDGNSVQQPSHFYPQPCQRMCASQWKSWGDVSVSKVSKG